MVKTVRPAELCECVAHKLGPIVGPHYLGDCLLAKKSVSAK